MVAAPSTGGASLPAPTKQPSRRPTLVRKRDAANSDVDRETPPSSLSKRAKVSFDNEVEVRVMDAWEKAPAVIREEVRRALERHSLGDDTAYLRVKEIFETKPAQEDAPSAIALQNYTSALTSNASALTRSCSGLVHAVLRSRWIDGNEDYVAIYLKFLGNLVSAQGTYLGDVLRMLVECLTHVPPSRESHSGELLRMRSEVYNRAHTALKYILRLVPSASSVLSSLFTSLFPHSSDSKRAHAAYVQNLLLVIEYAPELQSEILSLVVDRVVKIDVQVQVDLEDLADDVGEGVVQDISRSYSGLPHDLDDEEDSDNESYVSDDETDLDVRRAKDITANIEKLDLILADLFSYYDPLFFGMSVRYRDKALGILISQFTNIILPTYRSRHTQFLLFHFVQTHPDLIDTFVGTCVHLAFDKGRPAIIRQSTVAYLASFVARGAHVSSKIVRNVFDYIGIELDNYRQEYEPGCRGPDLQRYSIYYSLVQALLYIFCFRWRDLEAGSEEHFDDSDILPVEDLPHIWAPGVKETLEQNLFSRLNPLKVCSPAIVNEFAKIANHFGVIYVFHLLETNKRLQLSRFHGAVCGDMTYSLPERETALSMRRDNASQQLDEYFPFDPYHLPRSKRWIEGDYREWEGIPGLHDEKEDESDSEDDDEQESDLDEGTGTDSGD